MDTDQQYIKGSVTSKDGTKIAFDKSGKGPAVILIGGAFQHCHRSEHGAIGCYLGIIHHCVPLRPSG